MNYREYSFTASEITQLEYILNITPENRVVERIGLEHRLAKAKQRLEGVPVPKPPRPVRLSFLGRPVVDGEGIDANFGGKAATTFADSVAITVAGSTGQLEDTGAIPRRGLSQQLISGVTRGSFGFEIELPTFTGAEGQSEEASNATEKAVEMIQNLLTVALIGEDDELAELTGEMHPRAVRKVAEFVGLMKNNRAGVEIGFKGREVALGNSAEVETAGRRLAEKNIQQKTDILTGILLGTVPARRFFEFRPSDSERPIEGRIGREIQDPYRVGARFTNRMVRARIRSIQVGQGQPKYTLLEILGTIAGPEPL